MGNSKRKISSKTAKNAQTHHWVTDDCQIEKIQTNVLYIWNAIQHVLYIQKCEINTNIIFFTVSSIVMNDIHVQGGFMKYKITLVNL